MKKLRMDISAFCTKRVKLFIAFN